MSAYYNENNREAAAWLRELIKAKVIAPGHVDERDIRDVQPRDLDGFVQCHFFAGIGVWSYALRLSGWPDDRPVWTGSCPCQPFSQTGRHGGFADERHLWPSWFHLIALCGPDTVFGEQVENEGGRTWLDLVLADLEAAQYTVGRTDFPAAGIGAPHIRQRLWFVGDSGGTRSWWHGGAISGAQEEGPREGFAARHIADKSVPTSNVSELGDAELSRLEGHAGDGAYPQGRSFALGSVATSGSVGGFWRDAEVVFCRDGKLRPVEPGSFPLAHGAPCRVGRLRGYGNAIVAEAAAAFIGAYLEVQQVG